MMDPLDTANLQTPIPIQHQNMLHMPPDLQRKMAVSRPSRLHHLFPLLPTPQFTERVFALPHQHFLGKHGLMVRTLRWQLVPGTLPDLLYPFHSILCRELEDGPLSGRVSVVCGWGDAARCAV